MRKSAAQVQGLIFGALMAALVIIFAFTQVLAFLIPIPLVLTYLRYGGRVALLTGVVATLFSLLFASPDVALLQVLPMGVLPGLALGYGYRRQWRPLYTCLLAVLGFCGGFGIIYAIVRFGFFAGNDPVQNMVQMLNLFVGELIVNLQGTLAKITDPTQRASIEKSLEELASFRGTIEPFVRNLLPTLITIGGLGMSWLNMRLCSLVLPRLGHSVQAPIPFGNLRLPYWAAWGSFIPLLGLQVMYLPAGGQPWWIEVARNVAFAAMAVYGVVGAAVLYGWLLRRGVPKGIAIVIGLVAYSALSPFFVILAAWDAMFDFRQLGHGLWRRRPTTES